MKLTVLCTYVFSALRIFGELDFHPPNGFKFWDIVEQLLDTKFVEFPPKEIIDLLISFTYIERYPLNFVRKIFNPYFMDRLHNQTEEDIKHSRCQLFFFDTVMYSECKNYPGPYLPNSQVKLTPEVQNLKNRALNATKHHLIEPLTELVGNSKRIKENFEMKPRNPFFHCDALIYPAGTAASSILK